MPTPYGPYRTVFSAVVSILFMIALGLSLVVVWKELVKAHSDIPGVAGWYGRAQRRMLPPWYL